MRKEYLTLHHIGLLFFVIFLLPMSMYASQDAPLRVGMSTALSGAYGRLGQSYSAGALAGFAEANRQGGILGRRIELNVLDDAYEPERTLHNLKHLVDEKHVDVLFGFTGTPTVTRILTQFVRSPHNDGLLLFPLTGASSLSLEPNAKHILSLRATYADEIESAVGNFVRVGVRRFGIIHQSDAFGREGWSDLQGVLRQYGLDMAAEATLNRTTVMSEGALSQQVEIMTQAKPEAVLCMGTGQICSAFLSAMRGVGMEAPMFMTSLVINELMLKDMRKVHVAENCTTNMIFSEVFPDMDEIGSPLAREFAEAWTSFMNSPEASLVYISAPNEVVFEGYVAARATVLLLHQTDGNSGAEALRAAWAHLGGAPGVLKKMRGALPDDAGALPVRFMTVSGGELVPLADFGRWRR